MCEDCWDDDELPTPAPLPREMSRRLFADPMLWKLRKPTFLAMADITRAAVRMFAQSNSFLNQFKPAPRDGMTEEMFHHCIIRKLDQWQKPHIGAMLRIRLPNDYRIERSAK